MFPIKDRINTGIVPVVVITIILVNIFIFILEVLSPDINSFISHWALTPNNIQFNDPSTLYPFITSLFLHGGLLHILFNMWYLWIFGDNVEADLGKVKFILFYLTGGVIASLIQYYFQRQGEGNIPMLGASGAIASVLGYYIVKFPRHQVLTVVTLLFFITFIDLPAILVLGGWFVSQFFNGIGSIGASGAFDSSIAWWAHIGGFILGIIIALLVPGKLSEHSKY